MRKKDNYQPSSFISVYLLVKIKIKVVYDHEKKAQVTTETYKTYIYVSGNNDLLLRNEFCFSFPFLSEQADKGKLNMYIFVLALTNTRTN
jgi:predicted nucleic acid-binding Zn finger protein